MIKYICEPNPSGRGGFTIDVFVPMRAGEHFFMRGARYEVVQVQYLLTEPGEVNRLIVRKVKE